MVATSLRGSAGCLLLVLFAALFVAQAVPTHAAEAESPAAERQAEAILQATGVRGGLVVHVGCGDGELAAAFGRSPRFQVHGLDRDPAKVRGARERLQSADYGRVAVDQWYGGELPYTENLVNLVLVDRAQADVPTREILRVLVPGGVAYVRDERGRWEKMVKPRPDDIDEWTHYMHDASGNAVAHDRVVGPPRHLQWVGSPRWSRHHDRMASMSALVSAGGRIFYIMDEGSRVSIQLPPRWTLVARDAFNGTVLWSRDIEKWHSHLWPLKSGPTQLARRLVAVGERVYVTLGIDAPLTELDAATGDVIRTYEDSRSTEELILSDETLFLLVNRGESELADYVPQLNVGDQRRVADEFQWNQQPREIMAFDAARGARLWSHKATVVPLTLTADSDRVYFHDGEKVVCLDRGQGEVLWSSTPLARRPSIPFHFGPKLVVEEGILLYAGGDRTMRALDAATGKLLWSAPHARGGYQSPEDLLVVGGLVWSAPTTSGRDSGVFTGRDLRTGEVKQEFPPNVETYWFHHRCYMAKATDRFLLPSRTGIEFVDPERRDWDIHHWVRGGCLYGIMPCNGMVYAPPHNCACYPEAKLFGLNALAPASESRNLPDKIDDAGRLERGPAYGALVEGDSRPGDSRPGDWPTYRGDNQRSGFSPLAVPAELEQAWAAELGGPLSALTIAGDTVYVARVDAHAVLALDATSGEVRWNRTVGGRVDSPPTIDAGRVLFGSADGWVYCLRASDGELIWRYRAAPVDRRLVAFEQLESVWPVHGSVLVRDGVVHFVAGRSCFLDGGLRLIQLDAATGRKLLERVIDDRDPETGEDLQDRLQILQMPVGLPDVLSSAGERVFMRSQQFDLQGNRLDLGPHSGQAAEQGAVQRGEGAHLFSPTGFLDGTWFHRSYWVYGLSFAGGHNGYYQAGKYAPSGRILVFNDRTVYGFGRKPEYYRWTTPLEHQLFATGKEAPEVAGSSPEDATAMIRVEKSPSLNPAGKPITVEAWVKAEAPQGVVLARGGPALGYALAIRSGKPRFIARIGGQVFSAGGQETVLGKWTHLVGTLSEDKQLRLFVNGKLSASSKIPGLLDSDPAQALQIGADEGGPVGDYRSPLGLTGVIDQVRIYHAALTEQEVRRRFEDPEGALADDDRVVLDLSFDDGQARDASSHGNHGELAGAKPVEGKVKRGMRFVARAPGGGGSFVQHAWKQDLPLLVRAMVLADRNLFVLGPPDIIDEEESFQRLASRDPEIRRKLADQEAALRGEQGAILRVVAAGDGAQLAEYKLPSLPVWDGLAAAGGRLYYATTDGKVICLAGGR